MRKGLENLINKFLAERRRSDGGWAPVTDKDFKQLSAIIERLINLKWGKDPDGDLPIEYIIIDRTRYEGMSYISVPYRLHDATDIKHFDNVSLNAAIANHELETDIRILLRKLREKAEDEK